MSDFGEGLLEDAPEETRNWRLYVEDMIEFAEKVMAYTRGLNQGAFADDSLTYDATLRNLATHWRGSNARARQCAFSPSGD